MDDAAQSEKRVSIVVPAYNSERTLELCLKACLAQTHPGTEVLVVDDGSTDATRRIAEAFPIHYIRQENRGPASARNRGAAEAKGCYVAFTDADCVPEPDWIDRLLPEFGENVVGVGGTYGIANPESKLARMIHAEILLRHERCGSDVDFLGSFNVMYDRRAFDAVGGFDEAFSRASAEDNDLSYRMLDAGGKLRFTREAVVNHYHPTRLWPYLKTQARHGFWRVKLYCKHAKRARTGDRYAGLSDLLAPPMAILFVACFFRMLLARDLNPSGVLYSSFFFLYLFFRFRLPSILRARTRDPWMSLFGFVLFFRDIARGLGMCLGIVNFMILRRGAR